MTSLKRMFIAGIAAAWLAASGAAFADADWPMFGQNVQNTASQGGENTISPRNVGRLAKKWEYTTRGEVSARAAFVGGVVYFPDWGGYLHAVKAAKGEAIWSKPLSDYGLPANTNARSTPAVVKGTLYIGTQEGAWLLAIDAKTGALKWKTQLESPQSDPFALITSSPAVLDGTVYLGVASLEEGVAANPAYPCCKARGSVAAVDAATGAIKWKTYTVPSGYSGGGVWGSNLAIDPDAGTVFATTGNNYSHPKDPAYLACVSAGGTAANCTSPANHVDSVLALDLKTGAIKWATKLVIWQQYGVIDGTDDWNVSCLVGFAPGQGNCPTAAGPDYDFGSAPNLITYKMAKGGSKTIVGAGQKSGIYYALDPATGAMLWKTQVGPGSALGGMEWGSASDGQRIYVQIANLYGIPSGVGRAGQFAALDPATGAILWQTADPYGAINIGAMAAANGVVYGSSMAGDPTAGTMIAMDAATGRILWQYAPGSSVNAGATIVDGTVYWGAGYAHLGIPGFTTNNKFFAFTLGGN